MRAGTIIASNYFEMAKLLARSFLDAHPGSTFVILLVDDGDADAAVGPGTDIELAMLGDLGLDPSDIERMRTIYDVMELSTAVKPSLLQYLLRDDDVACYIDPDIYVYRSFDDVVEPSAREVGIVLTPHVLHPIPRDGCAPTERDVMQSGIMNLGFIAVGRRAAGFLDWWQERLLIDAVSDVEVNLFTDQRWIDWVPALFDHEVCRDPGMNIAWWNIHERILERTADGVTANGSPVRFVHFSGYSPSTPDVLSKHQAPPPRTAHAPGSIIRELADEYGQRLLASGHAERAKVPYRYATTADGIVLSRAVRTTVRRALLDGAATGSEVAGLTPGVPLAWGSTSGQLRDWLLQPDSAHGGLPRVAVALWHSRADLRAAFPDITGPSAAGYRFWLDHDPGAAEALPGLVTVVAPPAAGSARPTHRVVRGVRRLARLVARAR
jgi:hypothetical protein